MSGWGYFKRGNRSDLRQFVSAAALVLLMAAPGRAAAPTGYQETNIGPPDTDGSIVVNNDGSWTVSGSGNQFDGNSEDQLYFLYRTVKGDGSVQARMLGAGSGSQYAGVMARASTDANAPFAGLIMSTSALNWITRTAADDNATRQSGVSAQTYPKLMMVQRVGSTVSGYISQDGKLWQQIAGPITLPLGNTAVLGLAVSSRSSDLTSVDFDKVQVQEGVVAVSGVEGAATDKMALITWLPISTAAGYNVYRGPKGASLDQMTLLTSAAPQADPFYFDTMVTDTPLRNLSYVVAPLFKGSDGKLFEGPAVRVR